MPGVWAFPPNIYPGVSPGYRPMGRTAVYASGNAAGETTQELPGAKWAAEYRFGPLEADEWLELDGLMAAMTGMRNYVLLPCFEYRGAGPRGLATGSMLATAQAGSYNISVSGILGSAPAFRPGDRLTIASRMYMVQSTVSASGGLASVGVWPRVRASFAGQPVDNANPVCLMRLADDEQGARTNSPAWLSDYPIKFVEVLP